MKRRYTMRKISPEVAKHMDNLSNEAGVISALAIDQRGSLKRMLAEAANKPADETTIVDFKEAVSSELTPYASAILTDPEYGLPATKVRDKNCGLLLSYEKTGYDTTEPGRMCDLIADQSALRIKNDGADAVKFLLYYDPDESDEINDKKKAVVERVGAETKVNVLPFFLELLTYDGKIDDAKGEEYAKVKPEKVFKTMEEFSKPQYDVTVLKVEMPFNIKFVEGYNGNNNRSEEHTSELQSRFDLVCRLLLEKKKIKIVLTTTKAARRGSVLSIRTDSSIGGLHGRVY